MPTDAVESPAPLVVALTSDLLIGSFVRDAANQIGAAFAQALDVDSLLRQLENAPVPTVVVVDLENRGLTIDSLMVRLREMTPRRMVVAFGPHVHEARLQAARDAGCTEVVSRGKFHAQAREMLARALGLEE